MSADAAWKAEWVLDRDPLAWAQARHLPSGLRLSINNVPLPSGEPDWVATYTEDSQPLIRRLQVQMGHAAGRAWYDARANDALWLWRECGFDAPAGHEPRPMNPMPCQVHCWRDNWEVLEVAEDDTETPDLVHVTGLAFKFNYLEIDVECNRGWVALDANSCQKRNEELRAQLEPAAVNRIYQEAAILWMEKGYFEDLFEVCSEPFGNDWRAHWTTDGEAGELWLSHVSGFRARPVKQAVDESGAQAWVMVTHPQWRGLQERMEKRVGRKAWRRIVDQAGTRGRELGLYGGPSLF